MRTAAAYADVRLDVEYIRMYVCACMHVFMSCFCLKHKYYSISCNNVRHEFKNNISAIHWLLGICG